MLGGNGNGNGAFERARGEHGPVRYGAVVEGAGVQDRGGGGNGAQPGVLRWS